MSYHEKKKFYENLANVANFSFDLCMESDWVGPVDNCWFREYQ